MQYDKELRISLGSSRWSASWPVCVMTWSDFCGKLQTPVKGPETLGEFLKLSKADQDNRKDCGGYVGGVIEGERRKVGNVKSRDLITLDLDNIPAEKTQEVLDGVKLLGCGAAVYSTRKHRSAAPRLRIIIPTDRTMDVEEYEPAARKVAKLINIDYCDPTTFELNRLMFWPSVSSDSSYVYKTFDAPFLSVDGILRTYGDWKDAARLKELCKFETFPRTAESSTEIRSLLREGKSVAGLVPEAVDLLLRHRVSYNDDAKIVAAVLKGLQAKGGYCPCRLQKLPEFVCPCEEFRSQLADGAYHGLCHCRLYKKP